MSLEVMYQSAPPSTRPGFVHYPSSNFSDSTGGGGEGGFSYGERATSFNMAQGYPSTDQQQASSSSSGFAYTNNGFSSQMTVSPSGTHHSGAASHPNSAAMGGPSLSQQQRMPIIAAGSNPSMLTIFEYSPMEGEEGTTVTVKLDAEFPPVLDQDGNVSTSPANKTLRLLFGSTPVQTRVGPNHPRRLADGGEAYDQLLLHGTAPSPQLTGCFPSGATFGRKDGGPGNIERANVPVYVQVLDPEGNVIETKDVGQFVYESGSGRLKQQRGMPYPSANGQAPRAPSLKRSGDHLVSDRASPSPSQGGSFYGRRDVQDQPLPGQSPGLQFEHNNNPIYRNTRYAPSVDERNSPAPQIFEEGRNGYSTYNSFPDSRNDQSAHPMPPQPQPLQHRSSSGQPALMRTSQLSAGQPGFFGGPSSKATLELQTDLNLMAVGWNHDEWQNRRRLVQFWRRQEGSTIHAAFRAISQAEYVPNSIVISCVYRQDKNECFVTSVDAIYLLEALVGVRFSVEEKNRIRRNLEGFRPITVSKAKPGSEDFFKLIMSFPNPKPRNIEKDVKVFPWSIFGTALKKIISKYSASYNHAPNGNMGPPSAQTSDHPPSPPVSYQIPAPLMNPDGSVPTMHPPPPFSGGPSYHQRQGTSNYEDMNGMQQSSGNQQGYSFEGNELFMHGGSNGNMPPTPANSSSYNGISSSSTSSLPTMSHAAMSGNTNGPNGPNGALAMSRHASNGPLAMDNGGYSYGNGQPQPIGMSPSASNGSHTSHSGTGGFPPLNRHMTESPMHLPLDAGAPGYR